MLCRSPCTVPMTTVPRPPPSVLANRGLSTSMAAAIVLAESSTSGMNIAPVLKSFPTSSMPGSSPRSSTCWADEPPSSAVCVSFLMFFKSPPSTASDN